MTEASKHRCAFHIPDLLFSQVEPEFAVNFFVGMLPDALGKIPADSWDVVVCNSVFQYLATEEQARTAVMEMIRIAKRWVS